MTTKGQPGNRVVVNGVPITEKLTEILQNLIDRDPKESKNIIASNNLFIVSLPGEDIEQIDRNFYALQNDFYDLLGALEGKTSEE
jgi:hypothetical protein